MMLIVKGSTEVHGFKIIAFIQTGTQDGQDCGYIDRAGFAPREG